LKLLVTGGDGFTGRHFIKCAQEAGHTITILQTDLIDRDRLTQEVSDAAPDAVVHLAAISFVGHAEAKAFYDVNVIGTLNLLDSLVALPKAPRQILLASSANVYGNCLISPIGEGQQPMPVNHYAMSKLAMEYMAKNYIDKLPIFFVRPFNYTGVGQAESFLIPKLVCHFASKAEYIELGNLDIEREFNDVRFVCNAYLKLLEKANIGEIYNICTGSPLNLRSVISLLQSITNHQLEIRINPAFVRANEVHRLCGSPIKLNECLGTLQHPPLEDTLQWMLSNF
jgi:nucleoside-diphosphate-sugar epimerase